ncbi:MAG: hypothetical protein Q9192_006372 [Flavoplaca navasiana]
MKLILAICITALSTICAGQGLGLDNLPDCAKPCVELPSNCGIVDIECICGSQDWIAGISCCVANACTEEEQKTTVEVAQQICDVAKITLPTAAVCPDASGASTATPSASAGRSSASAGRSSTAIAPSTTTSAQMMESMTSPSAAAATAGEAGSSSGAEAQHVAPGLCGVAAIFGLALL